MSRSCRMRCPLREKYGATAPRSTLPARIPSVADPVGGAVRVYPAIGRKKSIVPAPGR